MTTFLRECISSSPSFFLDLFDSQPLIMLIINHYFNVESRETRSLQARLKNDAAKRPSDLDGAASHGGHMGSHGGSHRITWGHLVMFFFKAG